MNSADYLILVYISSTVLLVLFALSLIIFLVTQKRKQNKFREEKEKMEQEILRSSLEVQEKAINDMSQELHDNIGSRLGAVKRLLQAADMPNMPASSIQEIKTDTGVLLDELMRDTRNLSHTLNTEYIKEHGLVEAVKKELDFIRKSTKTECNLDITGDYRSLTERGHELIIFRMIQEAISNALKHGKATILHVKMHYTNSALSICIDDNGLGFDTTDIQSSGIGLLNMRNRVKMINGTLNIESETGKGTSLTLAIKFI